MPTLFSKAQNASFTPVSDMTTHKFHDVTLTSTKTVKNVTAAGDATVQLINGLPIHSVTALGSIYSGGFAKAQNSQLNIGTLIVKPYDWTLGKKWELQDYTGSGDPIDTGAAATGKVWGWGWPVVYGHVRAFVKSTGPLYMTESDVFTFLLNTYNATPGVITNVKIRNIITKAPIVKGGMYPVVIQWQANGAVTNSGGAVLPTFENATANAPPVGTMVIGLDTGETITRYALCNNFSFRVPAQEGGDIVLSSSYRFTNTLTSP